MARLNPSASLQVNTYVLTRLKSDDNVSKPVLNLRLSAQKKGKPSKRITLHQKGLRVLEAKITASRHQKTVEYETARVNHLKSFNEVRLHTKELIYPGECKIELIFNSQLPGSEYQKMAELDDEAIRKLPLRNYFPSIDEPNAKAEASFKILL